MLGEDQLPAFRSPRPLEQRAVEGGGGVPAVGQRAARSHLGTTTHSRSVPGVTQGLGPGVAYLSF